jgi:hypothetical protein
MRHFLVALSILAVVSTTFAADQPKPPVGVPVHAKYFKGKWYALYLENTTWRRAQDKCRTLGGQLVCIPDAQTQAFIKELSKGLELWIGATDEKVEGLWKWVDGSEVKYEAWGQEQPRGGKRENYMGLGWKGTAWFDAPDNWGCVGFICEWKGK